LLAQIKAENSAVNAIVDEIAKEAMASLPGETKAMLMPAITQQESTTFIRIFQEYTECLGCFELNDLLAAMARRTAYLRAWNLFLKDYPLVLTPFMMRPSYEWDEDASGPDAVEDIFRSSIYSWGINFLGLPASIAPAGYHDGLPISVQIVVRRFREDLCLDAAEVIEREMGEQAFDLWERQG
jgi:amidase